MKDNTAEQKPLTLQECKDEIAKKHTYNSWQEISKGGVVSQPSEYFYDEVAELHASQQTEALQAEIEQMHKECYGWADIVGNQDKKILEKDAQISQLEEALMECIMYCHDDTATERFKKALSQNNQPEKI
jgi:hypothetical protein